MAAMLALVCLTQKNIAQSDQSNHLLDNPSSTCLMWNPKRTLDPDDGSWEVRAFEEDTGNVMGTTWPPRSYTCTFCRREFRSAQALGGHMNVHRRDRARLQQTPPVGPINPSLSSTSTTSSAFIIPGAEFSSSGSGLCLLYQLSNPNGVFPPTAMNACVVDHSPSTLLSISPHPHNCLPASPVTCNFYYDNSEAGGSTHSNNGDETGNEEVDLELRLGQKS